MSLSDAPEQAMATSRAELTIAMEPARIPER
jgi:hypothetical protein